MKDLAATLFRYAIRVLGIELGLALIVGLILTILEHTLKSFGDWMFWAGVISLVLGLLSVVGYGGVARSGSYPVGQTVGELNIPDRTKADLEEERHSYSFLLLAAGVGILAIIIGQLV